MRLNLTIHFGLRGRQEHVNMLWGDMKLLEDVNGIQYVEYNERSTKTRQCTSCDIRAFKSSMHATDK